MALFIPRTADAAAAAPREILALYDASSEPTPRDTRIHRLLELPFNHLGYILTYHDVSRSLPPAVLSQDVAAVVSWFDRPVPNPSGYLDWLARLARSDAGVAKQMIFGHSGLAQNGHGDPRMARVLARVGLSVGRGERRLGALSAVVASDPALIGFEADFTIESGSYPAFRAGPGARSLVSVAPLHGGTDIVDLAVVAPGGGYVHDSAAVTHDPRLGGLVWVIDPFGFIGAVMGREPWPIPDVTTLAGRRLYFATVGPDGWLTRLTARRPDERAPLAAEELQRRLIDPFPDLPVSVGVVTGDFERDLGGVEADAGAAAARAILSQPQVEAATAGRSYLQDWPLFADYDPAREARRVAELTRTRPPEPRGLFGVAATSLSEAFAQRGRSAFDLVANAPRKYLRDPYSLDDEIDGALGDMARLTQGREGAKVFLIGGNARPFAAFLAGLREAGVVALGGGGGIVDPASRSVAGLAAFGLRVGGELQVYNALSSDAVHAAFWSAAPREARRLEQTIAATESPRRLKPFHLQFSAQSATQAGSRRAIEDLLARARIAEVVPVAASRYAEIVAGFFTARIEREGPLHWRITERGSLGTVRFDAADGLELDAAASRGVLGARRKGASLYVALDPAVPDPVVALGARDLAAGADPAEGGLLLEQSRWPVERLSRDRCRTSFLAHGYGPGEMSWIATPGRRYGLEAVAGAATGAPVLREAVTADASGRLDLVLPSGRAGPLQVVLDAGCGN